MAVKDITSDLFSDCCGETPLIDVAQEIYGESFVAVCMVCGETEQAATLEELRQKWNLKLGGY